MILGAFGALASYALFHVVTVFPLSWIVLYSKQSVTGFLAIQILAAMLGASAASSPPASSPTGSAGARR